jgi:acetylornithine deacetylase/succinyl-diaminopimelate desuccinylase-like protein
MNIEEIIQELDKKVEESEKQILEFFREIVSIPSMNSDIEKVGLRVGEEMTKLGFDTVYIDRYGSIVGRVGSGAKVLLYDSHLDTVGIGAPDQWQWDPFQGHVDEEGNFLPWVL